jgi:hypothetical protein
MLMRRFGQVIVEVHKAALESEGPPLVFDAKTATGPFRPSSTIWRMTTNVRKRKSWPIPTFV